MVARMIYNFIYLFVNVTLYYCLLLRVNKTSFIDSNINERMDPLTNFETPISRFRFFQEGDQQNRSFLFLLLLVVLI